MGNIQGEGRNQGTLFPVVLDDLVQADHVCRVIDAFVDRLSMDKLGFERAEAADTGRPGYDPRDLLKLYLYGYLNQIRSSRRLETECRRNVELMWLLGRLYPDHKSIAELRRVHRDAVTGAGAGLVQFAKSCGLIRGEWIAIADHASFELADVYPGQLARRNAARTRPIWEKACGKLPTRRFPLVSYSSDSGPTSLANPSSFSKSALASAPRPCIA
jgi:transposase